MERKVLPFFFLSHQNLIILKTIILMDTVYLTPNIGIFPHYVICFWNFMYTDKLLARSSRVVHRIFCRSSGKSVHYFGSPSTKTGICRKKFSKTTRCQSYVARGGYARKNVLWHCRSGGRRCWKCFKWIWRSIRISNRLIPHMRKKVNS
jgi:hypothetical protein